MVLKLLQTLQPLGIFSPYIFIFPINFFELPNNFMISDVFRNSSLYPSFNVNMDRSVSRQYFI